MSETSTPANAANAADVVDTEELRGLVADAIELDREEVTDDANFVDELQVDSLMALEIVVNLEKRYQIKIGESDFKEVTTFSQVRELVTAKLKEQRAA